MSDDPIRNHPTVQWLVRRHAMVVIGLIVLVAVFAAVTVYDHTVDYDRPVVLR